MGLGLFFVVISDDTPEDGARGEVERNVARRDETGRFSLTSPESARMCTHACSVACDFERPSHLQFLSGTAVIKSSPNFLQ